MPSNFERNKDDSRSYSSSFLRLDCLSAESCFLISWVFFSICALVIGVKLQTFLAATIAELSSGLEEGVTPEAPNSASRDLGVKRGGAGVKPGKGGEVELYVSESHLTNFLRGGSSKEVLGLQSTPPDEGVPVKRGPAVSREGLSPSML